MEATVSPTGGLPSELPAGLPLAAWDSVLLLNGSVLSHNGTLNNDTFLDEPLYPVPFHIVLLLTFFYVSISVAAIVGNGLVLWVVATSRRMQSVTNCFIANLALADVIIGLFAIPFQFQAALLQRWSLPEFMCPFCPFVQVLSVNVSVFTLTAIAVDRHRAVLSPLSSPPTKFRAKVMIVIIWLLSLALAMPMVMALGVVQVPDETAVPPPDLALGLADVEVPIVPSTKPFCKLTGMTDHGMLIYRMILVVVQYLTPLIIISLVYTRMAHRLWGSRAPGNAEDSRDATLLKNKKKVGCQLLQPIDNGLVYAQQQEDVRRARNARFTCVLLDMGRPEKFQREFRLRLDVCLRRSPAGRGSISRELSNLDSGRWEWPAHGGRAGTLALKNGDKLHPALGTLGALDHHNNHISGSNSGLSVLTGHTSLTP
ncbi:RYamide receptor-like [Frankliniella occidentalis]|uniref:RYamide receptor-like n=1 Tax=Frankliniella occidentalis TaxID=133901 RepID=A0A9C6XWC6_FRAOC|nr:RYamide receptor-like [Frankliniella occidentalis]